VRAARPDVEEVGAYSLAFMMLSAANLLFMAMANDDSRPEQSLLFLLRHPEGHGVIELLVATLLVQMVLVVVLRWQAGRLGLTARRRERFCALLLLLLAASLALWLVLLVVVAGVTRNFLSSESRWATAAGVAWAFCLPAAATFYMWPLYRHALARLGRLSKRRAALWALAPCGIVILMCATGLGIAGLLPGALGYTLERSLTCNPPAGRNDRVTGDLIFENETDFVYALNLARLNVTTRGEEPNVHFAVRVVEPGATAPQDIKPGEIKHYHVESLAAPAWPAGYAPADVMDDGCELAREPEPAKRLDAR
jgi:hypothetical protein